MRKIEFFPFTVIEKIKSKRNAKKKSKAIDQSIRRAGQEMRRSALQTHILLTGGSQSGKTTLIEQIKKYKGFTECPENANILLNGRVLDQVYYIPNHRYSSRYRVTHFRKKVQTKDKWLCCFDSADAVYFCSALDGYFNQNPSTGMLRIAEDIAYFKALYLRRAFSSYNTIFVLFITKVDKIDGFIKEHPPSSYFPDYVAEAENKNDDFLQFLLSKFLLAIKADSPGSSAEPFVVHHFLDATDIQQVACVYESGMGHVRDMKGRFRCFT